MADVFISYSRRDKEFVQVLYDALRASQYDTWVDWQDIAPTSEWWKEIEAGIEAAHTFIFVISQDSIASKYCRKEIDHALEHGKRLIPVLRRKDFAREDSHPRLGQHQWISFQPEDDFDSAFTTLVEAIDTDLEHKKNHTRLEVRAIEWTQSDRDASLLLRGSELNRAEQWLIQASAGKEPSPTELQADYIAASRKEATQSQEREMHRQRVTVGALSGLLTLAIGSGIWAWVQQQKALTGEVNAQFLADSWAMEAHLENGLEEAAVIQAMHTGQALQGQDASRLEPATRFRAISSIREVMYGLKEQERLIGHSAEVRSVAFSPDGQTIATVSGDQTVKLWSKNGKELQTLMGHSNFVNSVAFSSDGETLATASDDQTVKLWSIGGKELQTLKGHSAGVWSVAFSPDGQTLATGSADNTVKLWSKNGEELQTLKGHDNWVFSVVFSPNGQTFATASADNTVKLWSIGGEELQTFKGHDEPIFSVVFSPDGQILATASADTTVKLWSRNGEVLRTLKGHSAPIFSVVFSPNGQTLATASNDNMVKLWNEDGEELQSFRGHSDGVLSVAYSPDGQTLATASDDHTVKLWSIDATQVRTLKGHSALIFSVVFSPDGQTLATVSDDNTIKLWNEDGEELQTLKDNSAAILSAAFSPDGETLATSNEDDTIKLWNKDGKVLKTLKDHSKSVDSVAFSPDSEILAIASDDNTIKLWNSGTQEFKTLRGHDDWILSMTFSPDGQTLATASLDRTVRLWSKDGEELRTFTGYNDGVLSVAFSPDSQTLATASADSTVKLWSVDGQDLNFPKGNSTPVLSVIFSPDGQTLATTSVDNTVKLWSLRGKELQTLRGHSGLVLSMAFSPDGQTLATASADNTVKLWSFQPDDLLTRGCNWLSTYFIKQSPELLIELEVCQQQNPDLILAAVPTLVTQAENLAREGNIKRAIELFHQASAWDKTLDIHHAKNKIKNLAKAQVLISAAEDFVQAEQLAEATTNLAEAKQLDPGLDFEPETHAKKLAVQRYLAEGKRFVREGKMPEAIKTYREADALKLSDSISAHDWDLLCWGGSTYDQAEAVMFACEKAVAQAPNDGGIIDSRGLAHVLTGNTQGAIADFKFFIEWTQNEEDKAQRQEWIKALEQGKNPFTPEVLESLRQQ